VTFFRVKYVVGWCYLYLNALSPSSFVDFLFLWSSRSIRVFDYRGSGSVYKWDSRTALGADSQIVVVLVRR